MMNCHLTTVFSATHFIGIFKVLIDAECVLKASLCILYNSTYATPDGLGIVGKSIICHPRTSSNSGQLSLTTRNYRLMPSRTAASQMSNLSRCV